MVKNNIEMGDYGGTATPIESKRRGWAKDLRASIGFEEFLKHLRFVYLNQTRFLSLEEDADMCKVIQGRLQGIQHVIDCFVYEYDELSGKHKEA